VPLASNGSRTLLHARESKSFSSQLGVLFHTHAIIRDSQQPVSWLVSHSDAHVRGARMPHCITERFLSNAQELVFVLGLQARQRKVAAFKRTLDATRDS